MGKKSFNKRRGGATGSGGGKRGGGGTGGDAGVVLMEVDPPPAVAARIERNVLARQKVVLPSAVQKLKVPSFGAYIDATRAENPEEAIRALEIPSLRGIVSTNEDPRLCAHCSAPFPQGCLSGAFTSLHMSCGAMVCDGCFGDHKRACVSNLDLVMMHVKAGAPWALYRYAMVFWKGKDGHMFLPMIQMAADAGHPDACNVIALGKSTVGEPSEKSFWGYFYNMPRDMSSVAEHAERALVLAPETYRRKAAVTIQLVLMGLAKDGRFKEARALAERLVGFEDKRGFAKEVLDGIDSATCGPFYDQLATIGKMSQVESASTPSSVTSLYFLDQHNMSPEELRLVDYESGDDIFRMTCVALKVLSEQFALSSSPLLVGLGGLVSCIHHLMGQPVNRDFYRSIPTIMTDVANVLSEVDPCAPSSLLESEPFLLLLLTSVATHARTNSNDTPLGALDLTFRSSTNAIIKNAKLPNYLRALALVIQADKFCSLPYGGKALLYSSNCPREVIIRRKARALCFFVNENDSCPLKSLSARLLIDSANKRLADLEGSSRVSIMGRFTAFRFTHGDGSDDSDEILESYNAYGHTVGGKACDECGDTCPNIPNLIKCSRCCHAHFCSKECASLAWDTWHGKSCKKVGVFSIGDRVSVKGLDYDENGSVVRRGASSIIKKKLGNDRWLVESVIPPGGGAPETDVISSKNLYHVRVFRTK